MFQNFLTSHKVYQPSDIKYILDKIKPYLIIAQTNKKVQYYNVPSAFDIETSSFYVLDNGQIVSKIKRERPKKGKKKKNHVHGRKVAIMYAWAFGIYGFVIIGRTWQEFITMMDIIAKELKLDESKRLLIYCHNYGYEFQFLRHWLKWQKVFSVDTREPVYALTTNGLEFRCSYILSGYSLENLAKELRETKIKKLVGHLDYTKLRHSKTTLSDKEIDYCSHDVKIVMEYIHETIQRDGDITKIPLTKTGYVRNYCRVACFADETKTKNKSIKGYNYKSLIRKLTLTPAQYDSSKNCFQGGFTHANPLYSRHLVYNVTSLDFTSAYPAVMISERFPMSKGEKVYIKSKEQFRRYLKNYCCMFDLELYNIESKFHYDNYISSSKCRELKDAVINNGRVVKASHLITTVTEVDYAVIKKFYTAEKMLVDNFWIYDKGYLPTPFVKAILKLYQDKTVYKDVEGKELEYAIAKTLLNACYGMAVTDIVQDDIKYLDDWIPDNKPERPSKSKFKDDIEGYYEALDRYEKDKEDWDRKKENEKIAAIIKYNRSSSRFLFYPWGIWVTAYCRRNLMSGIHEFGPDYIYSDTDSIKVINIDKHMDYVNDFNNTIRQQLIEAMRYHGIDESAIEPKTCKGVKKCLGVWDFDGHYEQFKTLGAKRYLVKYSYDPRNKEELKGKHVLTVSGLNKQTCMPHLIKEYGEQNLFKIFDDNFYVSEDYTGKNTHTYIDEAREGFVTDYQGNREYYYEKSSIHIEPAEYSLSLTKEYIDFIAGIRNKEMGI